MRVTNQFISRALINQINSSNTSMNKQYNKISSNRQYLTTSENPTNNALAMEYHNSVNERKQYVRNIESATDWYSNSDASLTEIESIIQRCRELAVQGANGTWEETDFNAMASEVNEMIKALSDIANTHVGEEYIFAGAQTNIEPITLKNGSVSGMNTSIVNMLGEVLDDVNAQNPTTVQYSGGDYRLISQIDSSTTIDRSITGLEMFFSHSSVTQGPTFTTDIPPLETSTPLNTLNGGKGVQLGVMVVTDHAGIKHDIDLNGAKTLDDVIYMIGETGNFEAGIDEVPSETAVSLGLFRTAGNSKTLNGLSLGPLYNGLPYAETTRLSELNNGEGIVGGYLNVNTSDGRNFRVDLSGCEYISDVCDALNAVNGGGALNSYFDLENQRFVVQDLTGGNGDFSINSTKNQLYIRDIGSHTAEDLGLLKNAAGGNRIIADYQQNADSVSSPLIYLNNGEGVDVGYFVITNHAGDEFVVDVTHAVTQQDVIDAINAASDGTVVASYNDASNRIIIDDGSTGTSDFKVEEFRGTNPLTVSDTTSIAKNLGLLKSTNGNSIAGTPLKDSSNAVATSSTLLTDLNPPVEAGTIVIKSGNKKEGELIDLSNCITLGDVVNTISLSAGYEAALDINGSITVYDPMAPVGTGLTIEEVSNVARDLGFVNGATQLSTEVIAGAPITVGKLPTLQCGLDLDPQVTGATMLRDLNNGFGVTLGTIRIVDKAGQAANIDLRGCETVQDVLDKINDPNNGIYIEASINADGNGIAITDKNHGAPGRLRITDTDSDCAKTLGISGTTYDLTYSGSDLDPSLTENTPLSSLRGGIPTGKVFVQSGSYSTEIDLSECKTLGDVIDKLSNTDYNLGLQAWIDGDGKHLNLTNTDGLPFIKITDMDRSGMSEELGLCNSSGIFSTLIDLRDNLLRGDVSAISNVSLMQIDVDLKQILELHTEVGAKTNRVSYTKEKHENLILNIKEMLGNVEELDMVEAIIQMTEMETAYQGALQVGSRIMQLSLLDFLR